MLLAETSARHAALCQFSGCSCSECKFASASTGLPRAFARLTGPRLFIICTRSLSRVLGTRDQPYQDGLTLIGLMLEMPGIYIPAVGCQELRQTLTDQKALLSLANGIQGANGEYSMDCCVKACKPSPDSPKAWCWPAAAIGRSQKQARQTSPSQRKMQLGFSSAPEMPKVAGSSGQITRRHVRAISSAYVSTPAQHAGVSSCHVPCPAEIPAPPHHGHQDIAFYQHHLGQEFAGIFGLVHIEAKPTTFLPDPRSSTLA